MPVEYVLDQNYPNPFNPVTSISYAVPRTGRVSLKVYDLLGREVATLVQEVQQCGRYTFRFHGENLSSGLYLYRLTSERGTLVRKMLLMK